MREVIRVSTKVLLDLSPSHYVSLTAVPTFPNYRSRICRFFVSDVSKFSFQISPNFRFRIFRNFVSDFPEFSFWRFRTFSRTFSRTFPNFFPNFFPNCFPNLFPNFFSEFPNFESPELFPELWQTSKNIAVLLCALAADLGRWTKFVFVDKFVGDFVLLCPCPCSCPCPCPCPCLCC